MLPWRSPHWARAADRTEERARLSLSAAPDAARPVLEAPSRPPIAYCAPRRSPVGTDGSPPVPRHSHRCTLSPAAPRIPGTSDGTSRTHRRLCPALSPHLRQRTIARVQHPLETRAGCVPSAACRPGSAQPRPWLPLRTCECETRYGKAGRNARGVGPRDAGQGDHLAAAWQGHNARHGGVGRRRRDRSP
jgi:hypothetical protein